jgi:hypothetical protein
MKTLISDLKMYFRLSFWIGHCPFLKSFLEGLSDVLAEVIVEFFFLLWLCVCSLFSFLDPRKASKIGVSVNPDAENLGKLKGKQDLHDNFPFSLKKVPSCCTLSIVIFFIRITNFCT